MSTNYAQLERAWLCDAMLDVGPDAPTLCEGWSVADLAAHLVVRENRPDAALGILAAPFANYGDKVRKAYARKPFEELVQKVRSGPPMVSPTRLGAIDKLANTIEFFVHHEDVRRAQSDVAPRELQGEEVDQLWTALNRMAKMMTRKAPSGMTLVAPGDRELVAHGGEPMVTIRGEVGELVLFVYGRQRSADIELDGPSGACDALMEASFGI